jgi:hypothetical protein
MPAAPPGSLDPADWDAFAKLGHRLLDEALGYLRTVGERPVWQPVPDAAKETCREPLPVLGQGAEATAATAVRSILPYPTGNIHPRFFDWVHGSATAGGLLAAETDRLNAEIVADLQESGIAVPSTASLPTGLAIRVNLTNHRTSEADLDRLLEAAIEIGDRRLVQLPRAGARAA